MFTSIRKRLTYTNLAITVAAVFAITGGAYAAKRYVITSTKQISPKVLKQLRGKQGPAGPQGAAGTAGPQGAAGANGEKGAAGESVAAKPITTSEKSKCGGLGGAEYLVGGKATTVCNGSPWTAGGTLPSNQSETGEWSLVGKTGEDEPVANSASFNIPLAAPLDASHVHFIRVNGKESFVGASAIEERTQPECPGSVAEPVALPGNLCVYTKQERNTITNVFINSAFHFIYPSICPFGSAENYLVCGESTINGADSSGFGIVTLAASAGTVEVFGTWAVTAK